MSLQPALRACSFRKISSTADTDEVIAKNAHKNTIRKKLLKRQELKSKNQACNKKSLSKLVRYSALQEQLSAQRVLKSPQSN